ncbi:MAG: hypothetical protein K2X60_01255 [Xanthobacteraceae bacterium]|nr:hypothetical protein [Xanthobacteraceae bacterium]
MRNVLTLVLIAWTSLIQPSLAQIVDGNRAYKECEADDKTAINYFIAGVIDTATNDKAALLTKSLQYSVNTSPVPPDLTKNILKEMRSFCLSQPLDAEQIRDAVCGYLKSNSKSRNMSAARLTVEALQSAYPCKSG